VLLSMTGYGEAEFQSDKLTLAIELRALNNRYLKVSVRAPEPYYLLEPEFEKVIRKVVKRGTIQVHLRCQRQFAPQDFQINAVALRSYLGQVKKLSEDLGLRNQGDALLAQVLALPGVVPEPANAAFRMDEEWPTMERVLDQALTRLQAMRKEEGKAMARELLGLRDAVSEHLGAIRRLTPDVTIAYRNRLLERVRGLLTEVDVSVSPDDLIKEVSIFAERSDIAEEVVRLESHLGQFQDIVNEPESAGRKLEFLTQEMFRETNTIGSKASDVEISRQVVEIKGILEKVREMVQNVE
jgi:uncharacterized protein (TIGR00255 family)